jgi:transcription termination/antitermination protein NusG
MSEPSWHVLHVAANHEKKVAQHLAVRLIEHYLPLYAERSHWSDRSVMVERPLFAGYVFVRYVSRVKLSVISTPGVCRVLGDSTNEMVSSEEIERIRQGLASGCMLRPHLEIPIGTRVRVRNGVFEGSEGIVTELRQRCKVVITLSAVRQCFSLEVGREDIQVLRSQAVRSRLLEGHGSVRRGPEGTSLAFHSR